MRVADLQERAVRAEQSADVASATAVFNLAALLASDCGMAELARSWCHRLANAAFAHGRDPRHALEPVVNLARLQVRAGNGSAAWALLESLFQAIDTRTDTTIDGLSIPAAQLTATPSAHTTARSWLWTVLLGTGAHALASAGRWEEASSRLGDYKGVGARILDGRQISVIAHITAGRHRQARAMLEATQPGEPWEDAVTACLLLLVSNTNSRDDRMNAALTAYRGLGAANPGLAVFHTRLGLSLLDALAEEHPAAEMLTTGLAHRAAGDGYAARDLLNHPGCVAAGGGRQIGELSMLVAECGLGLGAISAEHLTTLTRTLDAAEFVVRNAMS